MARLEDLPAVTLDDLAKRGRELVEGLRGVTVVTDGGEAIALLIPHRTVPLADLLPVLDAMQTQVELLKDVVQREARSLNIEVEEFHYPTR